MPSLREAQRCVHNPWVLGSAQETIQAQAKTKAKQGSVFQAEKKEKQATP